MVNLKGVKSVAFLSRVVHPWKRSLPATAATAIATRHRFIVTRFILSDSACGWR